MDVEEDIDYYLAMEEEAQMEEPDFEEGWDNAPEAEAASEVAKPAAAPQAALPQPPSAPANSVRPNSSAPVAPAQAPKIR
jgi:hypothetical protein